MANVRIHGATGEAPIARFARDEAHRLKPLGGEPSFGPLRELTLVVRNDRAVEIDTNSYSVPWRLIGERVTVTVAAGEARIRDGMREVALHNQPEARRLGSSIPPTSTGSPIATARSANRQSPHRQCRRHLHCPRCCVLLPNTKQRSEGASDGAHKEGNRSTNRSARCHGGGLQLSGIRDQLENLLDEAARANLSARETLILLCEREIARKDRPRIEMALKLAHFPAVKELCGLRLRGAAVDRSEADPRLGRLTSDRQRR